MNDLTPAATLFDLNPQSSDKQTYNMNTVPVAQTTEQNIYEY